MLSLEQLTEYINALRDSWIKSQLLYKAGIDLSHVGEVLTRPAGVLERAILNKPQRDELAWWLYDCNGIEKTPRKGPMTQIEYTETGKKIQVHTIKLLHKYLLTLEETKAND